MEQARRRAGPAVRPVRWPAGRGHAAAADGIAAAAGCPHGSDIKVRIAMAAFDAGVMPSGFRLPRTEPVPAVSEILTAISLNPRRRHTICHLRPPVPLTWGIQVPGSGLREVSYAEFKRACQARGPRGPLHGHWPLLDRLAGYWFSGAPQARPAEGLAD